MRLTYRVIANASSFIFCPLFTQVKKQIWEQRVRLQCQVAGSTVCDHMVAYSSLRFHYSVYPALLITCGSLAETIIGCIRQSLRTSCE